MTNEGVIAAQSSIVGICIKTIRENALINFNIIKPCLLIAKHALTVMASSHHFTTRGPFKAFAAAVRNDMVALRKSLEHVMDSPVDDFATVGKMFDEIIELVTAKEET